ncbi:MAG: TraB/GumN family protein [Acidobacteriota bacterium]
MTRLELEGREIYVVATAHVSKQSVEDVRQTIEAIRPEVVCVELCRSRYQTLTDPEQWKKTDIVRVIRSGKSMLLLSSLIMTSFQRRIAKQLGVMPGAEMMEGARLAGASGASLVLADRDIQVTLRRTWGNLGFIDKIKMLAQLVGSLFLSEEIDEKTVEEMKEAENLSGILEMLADEFPRVKGPLVDERDRFLAQKIRDAPGGPVVAVLGAAHVPGVVRAIHETTDLAPLLAIPKPPLWPKLVKWGIPLAIVGLLAYGFFQAGLEHTLESVGIWVLVNGALAAVGAAIALGHPLTIVAAFLAAPLTSLNPMIAAGWVSGLVQAIVRRPTVGDLEALPEAITTLKGFWMNPVTRILLVVALSNVGSMLGTFISGGWIAGRSVG